MITYRHSVSLEQNKCIGCTSCLRQCPTEAIRVRDGCAIINSEVCIDCGMCIRVCKHKAKRAVFDKLEDISPDYKLRIALPAPALYGQFEKVRDVGRIIEAIKECGFDEVYEVARAAEIISECTRRYLKKKDVARPVISSACPAIVRLIRLRFPYLCDNLLPILPPVEYASRMAKAEALKRHPELTKDDICTVFISPCPAKTSFAKNGLSQTRSSIDYVVSISEMYFKLLGKLKNPERSRVRSEAGIVGVDWASSGGEAAALHSDRYLAADGMENAIQVLEKIDTGKFPNVEFVELNACSGGCVGGAATVENPYIARARLKVLHRWLPHNGDTLEFSEDSDALPDDVMLDFPINYMPAMHLNENRGIAMQMMSDIEALYEKLPHLDCGSCGSPTCHAFAEDVVKGEIGVEECIVLMRRKMREIKKAGDDMP